MKTTKVKSKSRSPGVGYVQATAGEFSISLRRDIAVHVLLAMHLANASLPREHVGPIRLIVPGGDCFINIQWLDHLGLSGESGRNTPKAIALERLASLKQGGH